MMTKRIEKKLDGNCIRMRRGIVNKSWKQYPTKQQLYGHQPLIFHHHHVVPPARISPTLSRHFSLSFIRVTSCVLTQLLYVSSGWSSCFCLAICGGPQEYITFELVLASPAVSCVSGSSNLYSFHDGRQVAVQLVSRRVLSSGLVQYCSQHSCVVAVKFLLQPFCQRLGSASIQQYRYNRCLEETAFHFIGQV